VREVSQVPFSKVIDSTTGFGGWIGVLAEQIIATETPLVFDTPRKFTFPALQLGMDW